MKPLPTITTADVLAARSAKHRIPIDQPYAYYCEEERAADGRVEAVATLLLSNRECPYRCVMCDLWKNTLDEPTPKGAVAKQVAFALSELPPAPHVKLYNSGNFFDVKAVPVADRRAVAASVARHRTVIVENHPAFCGDACLEFSDAIGGELEVAIGLETIHEPTLKWLNKAMALADFRQAVARLGAAGIASRAFVLLRPPGMNRAEGIDWAVRSVEFAWEAGARCVSLVPVRASNGIMEQLQQKNLFAPPTLTDMEETLERAFQQADSNHRVFMDLWDAERFAACGQCVADRRTRLHGMNLSQRFAPRVVCSLCENS